MERGSRRTREKDQGAGNKLNKILDKLSGICLTLRAQLRLRFEHIFVNVLLAAVKAK